MFLQICVPEHCVIESKPDNTIDDLRYAWLEGGCFPPACESRIACWFVRGALPSSWQYPKPLKAEHFALSSHVHVRKSWPHQWPRTADFRARSIAQGCCAAGWQTRGRSWLSMPAPSTWSTRRSMYTATYPTVSQPDPVGAHRSQPRGLMDVLGDQPCALVIMEGWLHTMIHLPGAGVKACFKELAAGSSTV